MFTRKFIIHCLLIKTSINIGACNTRSFNCSKFSSLLNTLRSSPNHHLLVRAQNIHTSLFIATKANHASTRLNKCLTSLSCKHASHCLCSIERRKKLSLFSKVFYFSFLPNLSSPTSLLRSFDFQCWLESLTVNIV